MRTRGGAVVTVNNECKFYFNEAALDELGRPDGVALMFDVTHRAIGIKPAPLNRDYSYRLRKKDPAAGGRILTARNFMSKYGIRFKGTVAFTSLEANRDGVWCLISTRRPESAGLQSEAANSLRKYLEQHYF